MSTVIKVTMVPWTLHPLGVAMGKPRQDQCLKHTLKKTPTSWPATASDVTTRATRNRHRENM